MCGDTWPGLIDECARAMTAIRPDHKVSRVPSQGCTEVHGNWKHWPCLFPQHGPGKKHDRRILLEEWQQEIVGAEPEPFVRGLIHSDGCRLINRIRKKLPNGDVKSYEYPRYQFTNVSTDITGLLTTTLDQLGVAWKAQVRKPSEPRRKDIHVISIARGEAVARMDAFVGPKH